MAPSNQRRARRIKGRAPNPRFGAPAEPGVTVGCPYFTRCLGLEEEHRPFGAVWWACKGTLRAPWLVHLHVALEGGSNLFEVRLGLRGTRLRAYRVAEEPQALSGEVDIETRLGGRGNQGPRVGVAGEVLRVVREVAQTNGCERRQGSAKRDEDRTPECTRESRHVPLPSLGLRPLPKTARVAGSSAGLYGAGFSSLLPA